MRRLVALVACLVLAACGGGASAPATGTITPAPPLRTDLLYGYFGQDSATVLETQPHTNLLWTSGDSVDQLAAVLLAKADGRKVVLAMSMCAVPVDQGEATATWWLARMHAQGLLGNVVAVNWCDEPDTQRSGAWTDAAATAMNAAVRRAMAAFPELHAAIAVVYSCRGGRPGIASFDWIGCDDYDSGCGALTTFYPLGTTQRLLVLPGGADPWRQDPACFLAYAEREPRVIAILPFIWQTVTDTGTTYKGIRENGMAPLYCQAGRTAAGTSSTC